MRLDVVDGRWRTLFTKKNERIGSSDSFESIGKRNEVVVVMGSGPYFALSDAMSCVMMGLGSEYASFISFDPEYYFRLPSRTLVNQAKYESYKASSRRLPKTILYKDGYYPATAKKLFETVKQPVNVIAVCPEGGLDAVQSNFMDLVCLIPHGIIGNLFLFDPLKYDYQYLNMPSTKVRQKPLNVTSKTPESFLFYQSKQIWLTRVTSTINSS